MKTRSTWCRMGQGDGQRWSTLALFLKMTLMFFSDQHYIASAGSLKPDSLYLYEMAETYVSMGWLHSLTNLGRL